jgi:hypothetical protein
VVVKGKGKGNSKGKGKGKGGHWLGYPKDAKGKGKAPAARQPTRGKSPSGKADCQPCKHYYTPEGCPYGKAGKDKCKFWHPGYCKYFQTGTCPLSQQLCVFLHKIRPVTGEGRAALTDEQKKQKKAEKKEAKQAKKANEAAGAAPPKPPKTPKGEKKAAKAKAQAQGKGQGRAAVQIGEMEYYEDETHIYTYVTEDMEYDEAEWYQDPDTGEWYADYSYSTTWDQ